MEPLIYYPTFEPPSEIWLKFALLYFDNFRPIVPYSRQNSISQQFRQIENETDLISLYSPSPEIGSRATIFAIEEVDKILKNTGSRSNPFRRENIVQDWSNPANWNFLVFREKFSDSWLRYCEDYNIGKPTDDGILLPEEMGFLFMTCLAKEIAFEEGAAIITDSNRFDDFTNYSRATSPIFNRRTKFAKGLINLLVPNNLSEITFEKLIRFRNDNRHRLRAFNTELDTIQDRISNGYTQIDFIERYNSIYSEYSAELIGLGLGIASIPFATYILVQNQLATTPEYIKEILGSLGMAFAGGYAGNKMLSETATRRHCKKYLVNLQRLR